MTLIQANQTARRRAADLTVDQKTASKFQTLKLIFSLYVNFT